MPFQTGNKLGRGNKKAKLWEESIKRAIKRREETDPQALDKLAEKLLSAVDKGDIQAMRELGDRLDGKAIQATEISITRDHEEALGELERAASGDFVGAGTHVTH